jgi:hypothetical protein
MKTGSQWPVHAMYADLQKRGDRYAVKFLYEVFFEKRKTVLGSPAVMDG